MGNSIKFKKTETSQINKHLCFRGDMMHSWEQELGLGEKQCWSSKGSGPTCSPPLRPRDQHKSLGSDSPWITRSSPWTPRSPTHSHGSPGTHSLFGGEVLVGEVVFLFLLHPNSKGRSGPATWSSSPCTTMLGWVSWFNIAWFLVKEKIHQLWK